MTQTQQLIDKNRTTYSSAHCRRIRLTVQIISSQQASTFIRQGGDEILIFLSDSVCIMMKLVF